MIIFLKANEAMTKGFLAAIKDAKGGIVSKGATASLKRKKPKAKKVVVKIEVWAFLSKIEVIMPRHMKKRLSRIIITLKGRKTEKISILNLNCPTNNNTTIWKNTTRMFVIISPMMKMMLFTGEIRFL